jgi:radical SAM superfamily enzyme YgiQ (UPF0313 family)
MKSKIVLINPWIYDFAALNLWSRPLGLLKVAEYLSQFDVDLRLIDCTDFVSIRRKYGTGKYPRRIIEKPEILKAIPKKYARYGISLEDFKEIFKSHLPCDLVLVTSIMSYWYPGVQKVIETLKSLSPDIPVILGGIYATLYAKHAYEHSGADYVFRGYITNPPAPPFNKGGNWSSPPLKKGDEARLSDKKIESIIESFGHRLNKISTPAPYYKLNLYQTYPFAPILTGMGCPFKCSYCASNFLFNGFVQHDPLDIIKEIDELYKLGISNLAFYDDALIVNSDSHLNIVLRKVVQSGMKVRFHCPNGIHAAFVDDELAYLMKQSGFTTIRLGLETANSVRQAETGGKVTTENLTSAVKKLKKYGFAKEHIGVYLMYGLPGQELEEVKEGVKFLKSLHVRINLTEFSPIPFTSCWDELKGRGIIKNDIDPLLTNNSVFFRLYSGYDLDAFEKLKLDVKQFNSSS